MTTPSPTPDSDSPSLPPELFARRLALDQLPLIDLEPLLHGDAGERQRVAREIGRACHDIGFFYIKNHGIPQTLISAVFTAIKAFFALPAAQKQTIAISRSPCHRGYFSLGGENLDPARQREDGDLKEGIKIGYDLASDHPLVRAGIPLHGPNQWPAGMPGWKATLQRYYAACVALGRRLMGAFALALGLSEDYFDPYLEHPMATLGPLRYPPQQGEISSRQLGAGAHTDFGCLTILAQEDIPGLQVKNVSGLWLAADPIPGTFVVNIGDMMARWSNDLFTSTQHRVINQSGRERYSLPFFFDPSHDADIRCLSTCTGPDKPPKYPPTTGLQHLLDMIDASFDYRRNTGNPER